MRTKLQDSLKSSKKIITLFYTLFTHKSMKWEIIANGINIIANNSSCFFIIIIV